MSESIKSFGARLRKLIEVENQTQNSVAAAVGVSPQAVGKWVAGGQIDDKNLRQLAKVLKTNWLWLRYGSEALKELDSWRRESAGSGVEHIDNNLRSCKSGTWEFDLITRHVGLNGYATTLFEVKDRPMPPTLDSVLDQVFPDDYKSFCAFLRDAARSHEPVVTRIRTKGNPTDWYRLFGCSATSESSVCIVGIICPDSFARPIKSYGQVK